MSRYERSVHNNNTNVESDLTYIMPVKTPTFLGLFTGIYARMKRSGVVTPVRRGHTGDSRRAEGSVEKKIELGTLISPQLDAPVPRKSMFWRGECRVSWMFVVVLQVDEADWRAGGTSTGIAINGNVLKISASERGRGAGN